MKVALERQPGGEESSVGPLEGDFGHGGRLSLIAARALKGAAIECGRDGEARFILRAKRNQARVLESASRIAGELTRVTVRSG